MWEDTAYVIALREPIPVLDGQNLIYFLDYWPSMSSHVPIVIGN